MKNNYLLNLLLLWIFNILTVQAQCDASDFTVTVTSGSCPADGTISLSLPNGSPCSGWQAILTNPSGVETILNVTNSGEPINFESLTPGDYNVRLVGSSTVIQYPNNPVQVTTSYQNMLISSSNQPPSCPSTVNQVSQDGTLDITINSGGTGPFLYELTSTFGLQSFGPTLSTSHSFGNMQGGESVSFTVTDLGCNVSQTQNPTIAKNEVLPSEYSGAVFRRKCAPDCNAYDAFFSAIVRSQELMDNIQLSGNATVRINGGAPQDLVFESTTQAVNLITFSFPQGIAENTAYEVIFNDGCSTFGHSGTTLPVDDTFIDISTTFNTDPDSCISTHKVGPSSRIRTGNETYQMFCTTNSITIEQETAPGVWTNIPLSNPVSNPLNLADVSPSYELPGIGRYRMTATDNCHTIIEEFDTINETNPLNGFEIGFSRSILEGTGAMVLHRVTDENIANPFTTIPQTTYQISPVPFVPSTTINPTHPYTLGAPYTISFPVTYSTTTNAVIVGDLPPGEYEVVATDVCGNRAEKTFNIQEIAAYNANIQSLSGCENSGRIIYDLDVTNVARYFFEGVEVELWTDAGNSTLGTLVEGDILPHGYSGEFQNLSDGNYILRFKGINFDGPINDVIFSAATLSNQDREYLVPVTIAPFESITASSSGAYCDLNDPSTGFIYTEITGGTPTYPIVYELYSATDLNTPVQTHTETDISVTDHTFQNVSNGSYVVRISTPCDGLDLNLDLVQAPLQANTSPDTTLCTLGEDVDLSIDLPESLFDIVWTDNQGNTVGTGSQVTTSVTAPTTFTVTYAFNPQFCSSPAVNSDTVRVDFYPELAQIGSESTTCNVSGADYTLMVELTGTPPYTVTGTGAPGVFAGNIWTSGPIPAGTDYNVSFEDVNTCSTLTVSDVAPVCCVFQVTCPTFPAMTVECYDDLPSATSLTEVEFEALGNADGSIGDIPCGIIEITASNSPDTGTCMARTIARTYTVTEYEDTNNNGIRDLGEDTVLNTLGCQQEIIVLDTQAPVFVENLPTDITTTCIDIPTAFTLTAIDNCDPNVQVSFDETITNDVNCAIGYTITRTWTAMDCAGNQNTHTQTITVPPAGPIMADYDEEITIICGEEIPPVPDLVFTGGCGDYVVNFTEETILSGNTDDFMIERLWEVTDSCGNVELFQQIITVVQPERESVTIDICIEDDSIDLIGHLPSSFDTNGTFEVVSGDGTLNGSTFDPSSFGIGEHQIAYSSTEGACKYFMDFTIRVNSDCVPCNASEIVASKAVTANSDGVNDFFEIKGGEYCDYVFGLQMFNRWGQIIYESDNYRNDWSGFSPNNAFGSSRTLPSGTYYYIITVQNQEVEPINGFIYLGAD